MTEDMSRGNSRIFVWAYLDNKHNCYVMKFHICNCLHFPFLLPLFFRTSSGIPSSLFNVIHFPPSCLLLHSLCFYFPSSLSPFHPTDLYSLLWLLSPFLRTSVHSPVTSLYPFSVSQPDISENPEHKITCTNFPRLWTRFYRRQGGTIFDDSDNRLTSYLLIIVAIKSQLTRSHFR